MRLCCASPRSACTRRLSAIASGDVATGERLLHSVAQRATHELAHVVELAAARVAGDTDRMGAAATALLDEREDDGFDAAMRGRVRRTLALAGLGQPRARGRERRGGGNPSRRGACARTPREPRAHRRGRARAAGAGLHRPRPAAARSPARVGGRRSRRGPSSAAQQLLPRRRRRWPGRTTSGTTSRPPLTMPSRPSPRRRRPATARPRSRPRPSRRSCSRRRARAARRTGSAGFARRSGT